MHIHRWTGIFVCVLLGSANLPDSARGQAKAPMSTVSVCAPAVPESLNPLTSPDALAGDLRLLLYTPLVLYQGPGAFRPYLASSWKWSADQRRLTLALRGDVTWHDGASVTAEDVAWTLRAVANPEYAFRNGRDFADLDTIIVHDSRTIEVNFKKPFISGMEPFVWLPVLPRQLLANIAPRDFARAEFNRAPIGSGPFRFAGRGADRSITFERHNAFPAALERPGVGRIVLRPIAEPAAMLVELETGNVDLCIAGSSLFDKARSSAQLTVLGVPPMAIQAIPLNTRHAPLNDARVRRALSAALVRADIAHVISPAARPARGPLPAGSLWIDAGAAQPDNAPALAASLLDQAGWTRRPGEMRKNSNGEALHLTLVAPQTFTNPLTVVQEQLRRAGVDLELRFMEGAAFVSVLQNVEARPDAMALGFLPDRVIAPDYYDQLYSASPRNLSSYASAATDSILQQLRTEIAPATRSALYRKLQRRIAEDVPTIYYAYVPRLAVFGSRLTGVGTDLNGPFATLAKWRVSPRN